MFVWCLMHIGILKPDGAFVGSMLGGSTLQELKHSMYLADQERKGWSNEINQFIDAVFYVRALTVCVISGGISPHTSPFARASDIAGIMQSTNFALPTVDIDTITVSDYMTAWLGS